MEKNGDYVCVVMRSPWCKLLDQGSRRLCDTPDSIEASTCGRWLCHESGWGSAARVAIETAEPTDIECQGGLRLCAYPILVGEEVVGAVNLGYGTPPNDQTALARIGARYGLSVADLEMAARTHRRAPAFVVELARRQMRVLAKLIGYMVDRNRAQRELQRSGRRLADAQRLAKIGHWDWNLQSNDMVWSVQTSRILGRTTHRDETTYEEFKAAVHPGDRLLVEREVERAVQGCCSFQVEHRIQLDSGEVKYVQQRGEVLQGEAGKAVEVNGTVQDITSQKNAEFALRESELQYADLFERVPIGLYQSAPDGRVLDANPALIEMLGYPDRATLLAVPASQWYEDPEVREEWKRQMDDAGVVRGFVSRWQRYDGTTIWVEETTSETRRADGRLLHYDGAVQDIGERVRRERQGATLSSLAAALRVAGSRAEMPPTIVGQVMSLLEVDGAALVFRGRETNGARVELATGSLSHWSGLTVGWEDSVPGAVISSGNPQTINGIRPGSTAISPPVTGNTTSLVCSPLIAREETFGAVVVANSSEIGEEDVRLLGAIGDMSANAIRRAALHEETRRRLEHLGALREIEAAISSSLDLRVTLNLLLNQAMRLLSADAASILLLRQQTQELEHVASKGFVSIETPRVFPRVGEGLAGRVALERRPIRMADLTEAGTESPRDGLLRAEGYVSYHGVPLVAKGRVRGVLEILHRAPVQVDGEWIDLLESLAEHAAIAIDNIQMFDELQRSNVDLTLAYDSTLEGWSRALDLRDKETEGHSQRVTEVTVVLARAMGLGDQELVHVKRGALLHDIGKLGIPDAILHKPGKLDDREWEVMRRHSELAMDLLSPIPFLRQALDIPYCHHERWDGTGYPRGLKGETIPLSARIFAVADAWDAITSDRPYRKALGVEQAKAELRAGAGTQFAPDVVTVALQVLGDK